LAIHLDRQEKFEFNKETQLFPIAGLGANELNKSAEGDKEVEEKKEESEFSPLKAITTRHHPIVVQAVADAAGDKPEDIVDFEMLLFDTQPAVLGGINAEFIDAATQDNQTMSYCATQALIDSLEDSSSLESDSTIRLISLSDHEEIGSMTAQGADSNL